MPRKRRCFPESGYCHIVIRGISRQDIFESEKDYRFFLNSLERFAEDTNVGICSYCLMSNHVHLLIHDPKYNMALFMKKLEVSYSAYFNLKYDRVGHVFQNRYHNEIICSENHFLNAVRYIIKNPEKAGICSFDNYEWNSYKIYWQNRAFEDIDLLKGLLDNEEKYKEFIKQDSNDLFIEGECCRTSDDMARKAICNMINASSPTELRNLSVKNRNVILKKLKEEGYSVRQLERLTGISRGSIQRL